MSGSRPDRVVDPVCGMSVDTARAEADGLTAEHNGRTYAFCRSGCLRAFGEDPAAYAAKVAAAGAVPIAASADGLPIIDDGMRSGTSDARAACPMPSPR